MGYETLKSVKPLRVGMSQELLNVWNEITISESGIGITLYSESKGEGARVEDETWFTFDELEADAGNIVSLNLSEETVESLEGLRGEANDELDMFQADEPIEEGDVMFDENSPEWSEDNAVVVEEVLSDVTCDEYVIQGYHNHQAIDAALQVRSDGTVADANPSYPTDDSVILAQYQVGDTVYAFPRSRLSQDQ